MHIGILSDPANFHTQKWARALQRAGAKITVFSFSQSHIPGVDCVSIAPKATINGQLTYGSYLAGGPDLLEQLVRHKIDLINPINVTPFSVWGMKSGFRPMVSIAMGADVLEYPPHFAELSINPERIWNSNATRIGLLNKVQYRFKWGMFRRYVQQALQASDLITGDNLELVDAVRDWFGIAPERVKLNRWGIEPELFVTSEEERCALRQKYGVRDWQKVVLSPRGMKPVYQGDLILEGFERLLRRGVRDLKLIMLSAGYDIPPEVDEK
ncbi:MAG: glycosyltransferase, partial [Bacteroidota bacterium]